jgi:hypothetical protein
MEYGREYVERVGVLLTRRDAHYGEVTEALIGAFNIGGTLPFADVVPEVETWLLRDEQQMGFTINTSVSRFHGGAAGTGAELLIAAFSAAMTVGLDQIWDFVAARLARQGEEWDEARWIREELHPEEPDRACAFLSASVAKVLQRPVDDLEPLEVSVTDVAVRGVFEIRSTGARYQIESDGAHYRIRRVRAGRDHALT